MATPMKEKMVDWQLTTHWRQQWQLGVKKEKVKRTLVWRWRHPPPFIFIHSIDPRRHNANTTKDNWYYFWCRRPKRRFGKAKEGI